MVAYSIVWEMKIKYNTNESSNELHQHKQIPEPLSQQHYHASV